MLADAGGENLKPEALGAACAGANQLVTGGNIMVLGLPASVMLLTISRAGALAEALRATCGVIGRG